MVYGETEHEHAGSEQCRPTGDQQARPGQHLRWVCGVGPDQLGVVPSGLHGPDATHPARTRDAVPDEPATFVPAQRAGEQEECVDGPVAGRSATCRSERPGWAGAYRHGAVRPRQRANRRERPPRRWC